MRKWGCHLGHPDWPHHRVGDDPVFHAVLIAGDPVEGGSSPVCFSWRRPSHEALAPHK